MNKNKTASRWSPTNIGVNLAIVVFNAALVGTVWIAVLEIANVDRRETINSAIDRNDNLAIALEQYTRRTIESADAVIQYMIREYVRNSRKLDLDQFVLDYTIDNKAFAGIVLADEHGNLASSAYMGKPVKPVNVADREHFRVHLARDTQTAFVGKPVTGRITGKLVVPITRRINKPDGSFGGVAMVLVEHSRFTDVLHDAKMRQLDIISLVGLDGITRARLRSTTPSAGEDIRKSPLFAEQALRPNGNYAARGQVDGVKRIFSYRTLPEYRLIATVGASEKDVLAGFLQRRQQYFGVAGFVSLLIAGFTAFLIIGLTQQRRAAASLARNQARFLATFNQAAVGIAHSDLDGICLEVNQKLCDIIGYPREELLGRKFTTLTHPDDVAASFDFRRQVAARPGEITSLQREKRYIHKNGSIVWCLLTTTVVRDDAGNVDYLAAIIQDISALKATEQALRVLEQEQRVLAQNAESERLRLAEAQAVAKIGSWETTLPDLRVLWSEETYRIFEVNADGFQPTHAAFLDFIHPDDRAKVDAAFSDSLADQSSYSIEHRIVMRDGRIKTVEERWRTFFDDQGQPVRVVGTCHDITEKKNAELDRAKLAAIVESSNDAIIGRNMDDAIVSWNQAAERMIGWTASEVIGKTSQIMTPPEYAGKLSQLIDRVKNGEPIENFETVLVRKNGVRFDGQASMFPVKNSSGQVIGRATIVRDITERKHAEQVQAQLAAIVESSNDAIISRSLEGVIVSWNKAAERMFGWTAAEAIGRPPQIMTPPDYLGKFTHYIERVKRGETTEPFETVRVRKNGLRFDAQVCLSAVKDSHGKVTGIATIVRDITDRKRAERAQAQLAAIVESSNDAIISRDLDGIIISWNRAAERMFGWTAAEIIGKPSEILTPADYRGKFPVVEHIKRGENPSPFETVRVRKDGARFDAHVSLSGVKDKSGHIVAIAVIVRDITERKLAEAALRDYAAEMRHLSWRLSEVEERERRNIHRELHDQVGANLAALKLDLGLINTMLGADAPKTVSERLKKTQQLTGETITRIRDVMADLRPPALDDYGLLAALRTCAQPYSARLGIPVLVHGDDIEPRLAIAVETALFRIVQEALSNIAKHAQARHVGITVTATAHSVTLVVADDGAGFDAGHVDPHRSAWGLRTMRERAQAIAAGFRVESSPGRGTRIIVELSGERT